MPITSTFRDSTDLLIACAGLAGKLTFPIDEFCTQARLTRLSRVVLQDPRMELCLNGLPPQAETLPELVEHLREFIKANGVKRTLITGTSGGAYTSLLLGHLLKTDLCVVFAPYTYLSEQRLKEKGDPAQESFSKIMRRLSELPEEIQRFFDLRDVLSDWNRKTRYVIHVGKDNVWDYKRAMHLHGLPNVTIFSHRYAGHSVAAHLAQNGLLKRCFSEFNGTRKLEKKRSANTIQVDNSEPFSSSDTPWVQFLGSSEGKKWN